MNKFGKLFLFLFTVSLLSVVQVQAQERDEFGYNLLSVRPIHTHDQMFKKTLWLRMDGKEKQNKPFFAKNMEITKVIIEAVKAGIIRPYLNDSLSTRMSYEMFIENLTMPGSDAGLTEEEKAMGFGESDDGWGEDPWGDGGGEGSTATGGTTAAPATNEYFPHQLKILEIREDLIFDRKRSRMYHDIQSITLYIPADLNPAGLEKPLASFSYKELVENVFKDNPAAKWYNNLNPKEHRSFDEAFELRLFAAHLTKYSNSEDNIIADVYGEGKAQIIASMQIEHGLIEFESDMWEN